MQLQHLLDKGNQVFALEIDFNDGVSQSEVILVRRPQFVIGASDFAHVVIEDMKEHNIELRIIREKGRRFRCKPLGSANLVNTLGLTDEIHQDAHSLKIGSLNLYLQALDVDLLYREGEPPDRAGVRILQTAAGEKAPEYPAVMVFGQNPMTLSFSPKQSIMIGRSNQCLVRLDSPEISTQHAKIGFEDGQFWIEDMGSTNGTYMDQQQIGGRTKLPAGMPVTLGRDISIVGLDSENAGERLLNNSDEKIGVVSSPRRVYPAIICVSEGARPSRVAIGQNSTIKIGRDPSSDMWLGVPHVSRMHCTISRSHDTEIVVKDLSTNGTYYDEGVLEKGDSLAIHSEPKVLDFGGGVTVAICFNEDQEKAFIESRGSPMVFAERRTPRATLAGRGTKSFSAAALQAEHGQNPSNLPARAAEPYLLNFLESFKASFQSMDKRGRMMFYAIVAAVVFIFVVLGLLLKPFFY